METFDTQSLEIVNTAVTMAEELVSNAYKMSRSQWLRRRFDVKTLAELTPGEIATEPFAQVIRYQGRRRDTSLGSASYDFYKICLQDHTILDALNQNRELSLLPFVLYIVAHELIHIVRFSRFMQNFVASAEEIETEERRVHGECYAVLSPENVPGMNRVLDFFAEWRVPIEDRHQSESEVHSMP